MNIQLVLVILCVAVAAFFVGRHFLRALRSRSCPGCSKNTCCNPADCPEQKLPEGSPPRR